MQIIKLLLFTLLFFSINCEKKLYISRKTPTEKSPEICIVIMSCNKYNSKALNTTLYEMVSHLEKYDEVPYDFVWIDTKSTYKYSVVDGYQFNKHVFLDETDNYVMTYKTIGVLCEKMPYILMVEEGMKMKSEIYKTPFIRNSIDKLKELPEKVYGLSLSSYNCHNEKDLIVYEKKHIAVCDGKTRYVNGAVLYRTETLKRLDEYKNSKSYNKFASNKGLSIGHIISDDCSNSNTECNAYFKRTTNPRHNKDCRDLI